ncbi:MAG: IS1634 family transposase, partial [Methanosarcinaceae archaeon]
SKSHRENGKRGRPKKDEVLETYYSIVAEIESDEAMITKMREKQGRFILATNDLDLTPNEILSHYKNQGHVERGFRFLKDKSFHVSEVYLKKESRIEALAMIMVLCLFLYSIAQLKVRNKLEEMDTYVKNQVNKPIQNPTMKWIFFLFRGISEAKFCIDDKTEVQVTNMTGELWKILDLLGANCKKYYL